MGPLSDELLTAGIHEAFVAFLNGYSRWGGWQYPGWGAGTEDAFKGPLIWSEADCVFRFALELERLFPDQIHHEVKINSDTRSDFNRKREKNREIDIVIADMSSFPGGQPARHAFRSWQYDAFIEGKYFGKGSLKGRWKFKGREQVRSVQSDFKRLAEHRALGRCRVAAVLVVDDDGRYEEYAKGIERPDGVIELVACKKELIARGLIDGRDPGMAES